MVGEHTPQQAECSSLGKWPAIALGSKHVHSLPSGELKPEEDFYPSGLGCAKPLSVLQGLKKMWLA